MARKQAIEPSYIHWFEKDFMADEAVHAMDWLQRLLYRQLCQRAPFCSTRPYLPDDDDQLWKLAGARDKQMWMENREAVLAKWKLARNGGRPAFYEHKRVTAEYSRFTDFIEKQAAKGRASGKARKEKKLEANHGSTTVPSGSTAVEPRPNIRPDNTDTETRIDNISGFGLQDGCAADGGESVDQDGRASGSAIGLDQEKPGRAQTFGDFGLDAGPKAALAAFLDGPQGGMQPVDVVAAWRETLPEIEYPGMEPDPMGCLPAIQARCQNGSSAEALAETIRWLPKSDYWGKEGKGEFKDGLKSFLNAYPEIRRQYLRYGAAKQERRQVKRRGA